MLFSDGACSRRVSLFLKPFSFPRRCAKLEREREKELGVGRERENFVVVVVLFCFVWNAAGGGERGKKDAKSFLVEMKKRTIFFQFFFLSGEKICLILKVARQTKKQEVARSTTKKRRKRGRKRARFTRCSCYVLCCLKRWNKLRCTHRLSWNARARWTVLQRPSVSFYMRGGFHQVPKKIGVNKQRTNSWVHMNSQDQ